MVLGSLILWRDWPESEASSWVSWSVSGLFSNPSEAVVASGNASSVSPTEPVGNTVVLPAGISVVTFIFPVGRVGCGAGGAVRVLLDD